MAGDAANNSELESASNLIVGVMLLIQCELLYSSKPPMTDDELR